MRLWPHRCLQSLQPKAEHLQESCAYRGLLDRWLAYWDICQSFPPAARGAVGGGDHLLCGITRKRSRPDVQWSGRMLSESCWCGVRMRGNCWTSYYVQCLPS